MNIQHFASYDAMSAAAADLVMTDIRQRPDLLLCAATGNSPTGLYRQLGQEYTTAPEHFSQLRIFKLDEWAGLPADAPGSCEHYLKEHLLRPLAISNDRYFGFDNTAQDLDRECERTQDLLGRYGPIDICILGLGTNGHLGLNEPNEVLQAHCHVARLHTTTLQHGMVADLHEKPTQGLTIGMEDILASRHIIMLVTGAGKETAKKMLLSGEITNRFPATYLWKHEWVDCLVED
ncbi:MAG: galactosamine-6-phosphate isomerase [Saprospiraceae bacterium]|nr:galactosamine-6-phosphate isomerase [Lewinella sp.]